MRLRIPEVTLHADSGHKPVLAAMPGIVSLLHTVTRTVFTVGAEG